jgi:outer membrane cobalamin receptor
MAGFQLGGKLNLPHNISIYPSVKIVTNSSTWMPVPKVGFEKQINASSKLTFNGFGIFTFPTLNQLYWEDSIYSSGNKNLKNEKGWGADIGFSLQNYKVKFSATAYTAWYTDKIQWAMVQSKSIATNVGEAAYFGGSFRTSWNPNSSLHFSVSYDCNATFLLTGDLTLSDNRRIMYTPLHTAGFETKYANKKYSLSFVGSYTGKQYLSNTNAAFIDPYFLLDFYGSYSIGEKLTFKGSVINLMNVSYYRVENYPLPGISVSLGLTYEF